MTVAITAVITNKCPLRCVGDYVCPAWCNRRNVDRKTMIDFDALLAWTSEHFPKCDLHISGGEPLEHPHLEYGVKKAVSLGHRVAVFSNAVLLPKRPEMYDLPVVWHLTHHYNQISAEDFLDAVGPVKKRPHLVCRIFKNGDAPDRSKEPIYDGFNFRWIEANIGYYDYVPPLPQTGNPNHEILNVARMGEVFNCSSMVCRHIGHIYEKWFDKDRYDNFWCPSDKYPTACQPYQSKALIEELFKCV